MGKCNLESICKQLICRHIYLFINYPYWTDIIKTVFYNTFANTNVCVSGFVCI